MRLECLNSLSDADKTEIEGIIAGLPTGQVENLQLLNALLIKQNNDSNDGGVELVAGAAEVVAVTDAVIIVPGDLTIPAGATGGFITPYDSGIYFTIDGTDPDVATGTGHYLAAKATLDLKYLSTLKMIAESGTANVFITYYK